MSDWNILNERELTHLEQSSGGDCDMAAVRCVIRELRSLRSRSLTTEEREALEWARDFIKVQSCGGGDTPFHRHAQRALSTLARILENK